MEDIENCEDIGTPQGSGDDLTTNNDESHNCYQDSKWYMREKQVPKWNSRWIPTPDGQPNESSK